MNDKDLILKLNEDIDSVLAGDLCSIVKNDGADCEIYPEAIKSLNLNLQKFQDNYKEYKKRKKVEEEQYKSEIGRSGHLQSVRNTKKKKRRKIIGRLSVFLSLVCIVLVFFFNVIYPRLSSVKYEKANELMSNGNYAEAYEQFNNLQYKDSAGLALTLRNDVIKNSLKNASVGDTVIFGTYSQDRDNEKHFEDLEWKVIDKKDGKLLLICNNSIEFSRYFDRARRDVTWKESKIREELNNDFYNAAFADFEKEMIQQTGISNPDNEEYGTDGGGHPTSDNVFCLSIDEAKLYFASDSERRVEPTEVAKYGTGTDGSKWWLRSPGKSNQMAAYVDSYGYINTEGYEVYKYAFVRPAIWVEIPE